MIIQNIFAQEIFTAQGMPTIQCTIELANGVHIKNSIPAGFNTPHAAIAYAYDSERIVKQRMQQSIQFINTIIAPLFVGKPINALAMDSALIDLHVNHENSLGSNTTLVISLSLFQAQAQAEGIQLYQLLQSISGTPQIHMPRPLVSIFECRQSPMQDLQELLVIPPTDITSYEQQLHSVIQFHHHAKKILELKKLSTSTGVYGSFVPHIANDIELFHLVDDVTATLPEYSYQFGIAVNSDHIYDPETKLYRWNNQLLTHNALIDQYKKMLAAHPAITYLQDGMASSDVLGWQQMTAQLPETISLAGDAIFGTSPMKIRWGILKKIASMVVIRPEYISTMSQALAAIDACKNNNKQFLIAGDSLGTHDTFIADLAVGTGATYLKAGAVSGSEHMAKYNRLLEIERNMQK